MSDVLSKRGKRASKHGGADAAVGDVCPNILTEVIDTKIGRVLDTSLRTICSLATKTCNNNNLEYASKISILGKGYASIHEIVEAKSQFVAIQSFAEFLKDPMRFHTDTRMRSEYPDAKYPSGATIITFTFSDANFEFKMLGDLKNPVWNRRRTYIHEVFDRFKNMIRDGFGQEIGTSLRYQQTLFKVEGDYTKLRIPMELLNPVVVQKLKAVPSEWWIYR